MDAPPASSPPAAPTPAWEDASFGLDPSADVTQHLEGRRWLPGSLAARKDATSSAQAAVSPTASGTWRHLTSALAGGIRHRTTTTDSRTSAMTTTKSGRHRCSSVPIRPPRGSLTSSLLTRRSVSWTRRLSLLASSAVINIVLPFINGFMLGTGEIMARSLIAPALLLAWSRSTAMAASKQ